MQSDRFSSFGAIVHSVKDLIELGLGDEVAAEHKEWLRERKSELEKYHKAVAAPNYAFHFPTSFTPSPFPCIEVPTCTFTSSN